MLKKTISHWWGWLLKPIQLLEHSPISQNKCHIQIVKCLDLIEDAQYIKNSSTFMDFFLSLELLLLFLSVDIHYMQVVKHMLTTPVPSELFFHCVVAFISEWWHLLHTSYNAFITLAAHCFQRWSRNVYSVLSLHSCMHMCSVRSDSISMHSSSYIVFLISTIH